MKNTLTCYSGNRTNLLFYSFYIFLFIFCFSCKSENDTFVSGYNCNKTTTSQHFVLSVFRFAGSAPGDLIFFHCDVVLCLISTVDSSCSTECAACPSGMRRRRAVEDNSRNDLAEKHLVLGPYKVIDSTDAGNNGDDDENVDGGQTKGEGMWQPYHNNIHATISEF